jgi:hypothetical protein
MPLRGYDVVNEQVGTEQWCVKFSMLAIRDRIWEFEAYRHPETPADGANLFWSEEHRAFVGNSRSDVPSPVLERVVEWVRSVVSIPT